MKHYFIKDKTKSGDITFKYTPSTNILANILTKLLVHKAIQKITVSLELRKEKNPVFISLLKSGKLIFVPMVSIRSKIKGKG